MKAGILLIGGAVVIVLYLLFTSNQSGGPLSNQPSVLQRLFPGNYAASGLNPSPLTSRNLLPVNYMLPQTSQSPVGSTAMYISAGLGSLAAIARLYQGLTSRVPPVAVQAGSGITDGLPQGPTQNGTPLSVSAGWVPQDSVIANVDLVPPVMQSISPVNSLSAANVGDSPTISTPLYDDPSLATSGLGYGIDQLYPGYDSTIPVTTEVSLPDATTPDSVLV